MGYRIEEEEEKNYDMSLSLFGEEEEWFDAVAKEILDEEEYEAAYEVHQEERSYFSETGFLRYVSEELEDIHGDRYPFREYHLTFSADEPLDEDEFLGDVRDAIRWNNNTEGKLKVDPRSRRAAYELYVAAVWTFGAPILGYTAAVSGNTVALGYASLLGTAGITLAAHAKYKLEHLPSFEIGYNIEKKLSLEELETDLEDESLYELSYRVRTPEAYRELAKNDAAAVRRTPGFVKSVTWDQLVYIGKSTVNGTREKAPVVKEMMSWEYMEDVGQSAVDCTQEKIPIVKEKMKGFWDWLRSEDFSYSHTLKT